MRHFAPVQNLKSITLLLLFGWINISYGQKNPEAQKIKAFDQWAEQAMKNWDLPGMAVTIVKDGKVLLAKGYGVRELGKPDAVDMHTQFSIGSTTKAMTAVCMGMLVDEGLVKWDDPVVQHLPEMQLYDAYATRSLRIRDLFTHNSGVGNTDFLWGNMSISSEAITQKMRDVEPAYPLRGGFIYQNIFYLIAGQVIERVSGTPWDRFIRERIFKPLNMIHTVPLLKDTHPENQSTAHYKVEGKITPIKHMSADAVGPAGSVYACIDDLSKWTISMLDSSKYAGGRLLKPSTWAEMFKPQVIVPASQFYPTMQIIKPSWTTYGLGWFQHDYKGRKVNYHTGSLPGEIAMHAQLPSEKLGFFFVGNKDHAELRHAMVYKTFDLFALGGTTDWSSSFKTLYDGIEARINTATQSKFEGRNENTKPDHQLSEYAGTYHHKLYGTITAEQTSDGLKINLNQFVFATATHWQYETFLVQYNEKWMGKSFITFQTGENGKVTEVESDGIHFIKQ